MDELFTGYYQSPIGMICIQCNRQAVVRLHFVKHPDEEAIVQPLAGSPPVLKQALEQVAQYFEGRRQSFDVPVDLSGSPYYIKVWRELMHIPYGTTCSYGALAAAVGNAKAARAVGLANNRNPVSIIVPCHRVIGANGTLVGYGGGLHRKQWLLDWEKSHTFVGLF
ncbi:MAG: methylated-DNA--[protein]-cysteine S-methyltransferase [Bacteroidales bacterium]|nr:methylated-DNA--[protein]-cysteine S-methyltransferase [Bacteroidales bacterium]